MFARRSTHRLVAAVAALVTALVAGLVAPSPLVPGAVGAPPAAAEETGEAGEGFVDLRGRGWGHGRGMGQYGALGYALDHGWDAGRILDHFYGGTSAGAVQADQPIGVALLAHSGKPLVVHVGRGQLQTDPGGAAPKRAVRIELAAHGSFQISDGDGCTGPWTPRPQLVAAQQITVTPPVSPPQTHDDMLQVCEFSADGAFARTRWYRGNIAAVSTTEGLRAVNRLSLDTYLRGVVPREMPASWGDLGSGRGMHALRAQAVAARSYAASERRWPYAGTCDTQSCQVYGGHALQAAGGTFVPLEDSRTDRAIVDTAGQVRVRSGAVARTEFSSSTGGWTAGGTFPAVPDEGDGVDRNPNHQWTAEVPFEAIEQKVGEGRGSFRGIEVLERNGLGADGGRVLRVEVRFSGGDVTLTGNQLRSKLGLKSDWFVVAALRPLEELSGYVLDGWGGLHPFGGAPPAVGFTYWSGQDVARRVVVRPDGAGYVLDRFGGIHPFGTSTTPRPPRPYEGQKWPGWSIARDLALLPGDPGSGYVLDGFGGVHPFGAAPRPIVTGYWRGWDIARRIVVNPSGTGGYVMDAYGGLHPFAIGANPLPPKPSGLAYWRGWHIARDVVLAGDTSGWTLDAFGGMHAFGGATGKGSFYSSREALAISASAQPTGDVAVYMDAYGGLHTAPPGAFVESAERRWPGWKIARDVAVRPS